MVWTVLGNGNSSRKYYYEGKIMTEWKDNIERTDYSGSGEPANVVNPLPAPEKNEVSLGLYDLTMEPDGPVVYLSTLGNSLKTNSLDFNFPAVDNPYAIGDRIAQSSVTGNDVDFGNESFVLAWDSTIDREMKIFEQLKGAATDTIPMINMISQIRSAFAYVEMSDLSSTGIWKDDRYVFGYDVESVDNFTLQFRFGFYASRPAISGGIVTVTLESFTYELTLLDANNVVTARVPLLDSEMIYQLKISNQATGLPTEDTLRYSIFLASLPPPDLKAKKIVKAVGDPITLIGNAVYPSNVTLINDGWQYTQGADTTALDGTIMLQVLNQRAKVGANDCMKALTTAFTVGYK
jgi:hypothetical protein